MKWLVACLVTAVGLAGCKSSQAPFNTMAPFGSSRVPPPSTNNMNASGPYYNRAATPQTATPTMPGSTTVPAASQPAGSTNGKMTTSAGGTGTNGAWQPPANTANAGGTTKTTATSPGAPTVQAASYHAGTDATKNATSSAAPAGSSLRLSGMQVNDATTSGAATEPARFVPTGPPVEIAQLPRTVPASGTTPTSGTVVASAQASVQPAPASASAPSTLEWKSRPEGN